MTCRRCRTHSCGSSRDARPRRPASIPIEDNPSLFLGEKGCYLNLTANDTHYVKGDIPKDLYDRMTDDQRRSYPILGNMRPIGPRQQTVSATVDMSAPEDQPQDDLPF